MLQSGGSFSFAHLNFGPGKNFPQRFESGEICRRGVRNLAGSDVNVTNIGGLATGGWIDFVARLDWTTSTNGRVQLWRNGVLVFDVTGIQSLNSANADGSSYWKQGVYIGHPSSSTPWPTNLSVFQACARRGSSYAAVTATSC